MTPAQILTTLGKSGIGLRLTPDRQSLVAPAGRLTLNQRNLILRHRAELIGFLFDAQETSAQLLDAAMRVCDQYSDHEAEREQLPRSACKYLQFTVLTCLRICGQTTGSHTASATVPTNSVK